MSESRELQSAAVAEYSRPSAQQVLADVTNYVIIYRTSAAAATLQSASSFHRVHSRRVLHAQWVG